MQPDLSAFNRRAVLSGGVALLGSTAWSAEPPEGRLRFAVFRNGARIGEQQMSFARAGSLQKVTTEVAMTVRLGPIPVFRYSHHAVEQWRDGRFERIDTTTSSNGKRERVSAARTDGALRIETVTGVSRGPETAAPLTHWNPAVLTGPLFNPQTGKLLKVTAQRHEGDRLPPPLSGPATRWTVRGDAEIDDFYDGAGVWTALRGRLEDHSTIEYRRL